MRGNVGVDPAPQIALVFKAQRVGIVLGVPEHEELAAVRALHDVQPGLVRLGNNLKVGASLDHFTARLGVPRVHSVEPVIESAHERRGALHQPVLVNTGELCGELPLANAVMVVEPCLRAPANVQRGVHVLKRPIHNALKLRPIINILEIKLLDRRARDDEPVEMLMLNLFERAIERLEMVF